MKGGLRLATKYTTISGDEWDGICYKVYGSNGEMVMDKVMQANPAYISIVIFPANIELVMPEISTQQQDDTNLPPWLR